MSEMSSLLRILMRVLRKASWAASILLLLFAAILVYQRLTPGGGIAFQRGDFGFLAVLAALFLFAVYLVRAIGKEIKRSGG